MSHHDLVVLARRPRTIRQYRLYTAVMGGLASLMPYDRRWPWPAAVGGHIGVTRSLVAGLTSLDADFAYEPDLRHIAARAAIVLCGVDGLRDALAWKAGGGCQVLLAGPNIVDDPREHDGLLLSPGIDRIIVASDKVRDQHAATAPASIGRVSAWPAGVDAEYWRPSGRRARDLLLIYNKRMDDLAGQVEARLKAAGLPSATISYSGKRQSKYTLAGFRALLDRSAACIFLSETETQGLAALEAWSMDVPTLAFDRDGRPDFPPLPYLSAATGTVWCDLDQLMGQVGDLIAARSGGQGPSEPSPRAWVLANMTDRLSAERLLRLTRI